MVIRGCAVVLFGLAWLLLFLVVGIGAAYGSDDPLLAVYAGLLVAGVGIMWRGVARRRPASHAGLYVAAVATTLWLGSIYG